MQYISAHTHTHQQAALRCAALRWPHTHQQDALRWPHKQAKYTNTVNRELEKSKGYKYLQLNAFRYRYKEVNI